MKITIPFGKSTQELNISDERVKAVLKPAHQAGTAENTFEMQSQTVQNALENPIASERLADLAADKKTVLIISSDHTRPVPSAVTMPLLLKEVRSKNPDVQITILIATGMHRPTTEAELRAKYGDRIVDEEHIVVHKAQEAEDMAFFGHLPSGGELWLNKLVKESELVISEGFIEPHFFAGFSGGRKSILPGVASAKTVLYNHNAIFIRNRNSRQGNLENNLIHQDMLYAAEQAKLAFILNVLIDAEKRVIAAVAGDRVKAHLEGTRKCEAMTRVAPVVSDIAITSNGGYPLDQNVYQSVKGMTAAEACVKEGGVIIMNAALGDGHGGEAFYRWFKDRPSAAKVAEDIENVKPEETHMDQWEAQILARVLKKAECIFVTGEENRALIEDMHMTWAPDVNTAMSMADERMGRNASVTVIPDGVGVIV